MQTRAISAGVTTSSGNGCGSLRARSFGAPLRAPDHHAALLQETAEWVLQNAFQPVRRASELSVDVGCALQAHPQAEAGGSGARAHLQNGSSVFIFPSHA
jgi:hypothetical protein